MRNKDISTLINKKHQIIGTHKPTGRYAIFHSFHDAKMGVRQISATHNTRGIEVDGTLIP